LTLTSKTLYNSPDVQPQQGWARAAACSAEAQGFGMCRSAEAHSFLDPPLRAAARGLNGCSGKKRSKKLRFFLVKILEKNRFSSFLNQF
jgi:hypothetical protein